MDKIPINAVVELNDELSDKLKEIYPHELISDDDDDAELSPQGRLQAKILGGPKWNERWGHWVYNGRLLGTFLVIPIQSDLIVSASFAESRPAPYKNDSQLIWEAWKPSVSEDETENEKKIHSLLGFTGGG